MRKLKRKKVRGSDANRAKADDSDLSDGEEVSKSFKNRYFV